MFHFRFSRSFSSLLIASLVITILGTTAILTDTPTAAQASSSAPAAFFSNDASQANLSMVSTKNDLSGPWELMSGGVPWSRRAGHTSVVLSDDSIILMGGYDGEDSLNDVWRSTDGGKTWTLVTAAAEWSPRSSHASVVLPDDSIVLMGGSGAVPYNDVWRSTDQGTSWTEMTAAAEWSARNDHSSVVLSDGSIVLMGGGSGLKDVWRSTDQGASWVLMTDTAGPSRFSHTSVALSNDHIIVMGGYFYSGGDVSLRYTSNAVFISEDMGATWEYQAGGARSTGGHASLVTSDDSIFWMGGFYYTPIVGSDSYYTDKVWRSDDEGETWTEVTDSPGWTGRSGHSSVILSTGEIVLMGGYTGGQQKDVWSSTDGGNNWTQPPHWGGRYDHTSVVLEDDSIVLMGGAGYFINGASLRTDVWRSTDGGKTWTLVTAAAEWSPRSSHASVVTADGDILLIGGAFYSTRFNDVWLSSDKGETWTQQTAEAEWIARDAHTTVVLSNGNIVLMGGYGLNDGSMSNNDVWLSSDKGKTWTQQTAEAEWIARYDHSTVVLPGDIIVLMGGYGGGSRLNDVWMSEDEGKTWTEVTNSPGWTGRSGHSSECLSTGEIVLMGGYTGVQQNDVWVSSDDGQTWTQVSTSAEWSARTHHASVVDSNDAIYLLGGYNKSNEVWRLGDSATSNGYGIFLPLLMK